MKRLPEHEQIDLLDKLMRKARGGDPIDINGGEMHGLTLRRQDQVVRAITRRRQATGVQINHGRAPIFDEGRTPRMLYLDAERAARMQA